MKFLGSNIRFISDKSLTKPKFHCFNKFESSKKYLKGKSQLPAETGSRLYYAFFEIYDKVDLTQYKY